MITQITQMNDSQALNSLKALTDTILNGAIRALKLEQQSSLLLVKK